MDWQLIEDIPWQLDFAAFAAEMRLKAASRQSETLQALAQEAQALARPRACWCKRRIERLDASGLEIAGIRLASPLFALHLQQEQEICLFLASAGAEVCAWSGGDRTDALRSYWRGCLAEKALQAAAAHLEAALLPVLGAPLAVMNPGALPAWPLDQQRPLFQLLGGAAAACGVALSEDCLMTPLKSLSGFYFRSPRQFSNCRLCPRLRCADRRAAFAGETV